MRKLLIILVMGASIPLYSCGIHQYRMALNARNYSNPAAICPYCNGSVFASVGANRLAGNTEKGMFISLGDDGNNVTHGVWDYSYGTSVMQDLSLSSHSARYAWKQNTKRYTWTAGIRVNLSRIGMKYQFADGTSSEAFRSCKTFDAGFMITDRKGLYFGVSVQNVLQPRSVFTFNDQNVWSVYSVQTNRNSVVLAGGVIPVSFNWDFMIDQALGVQEQAYGRTAGMIRFGRRIGVGAAINYAESEKGVWEIQGGYTSSVFKWLASVSFTPVGSFVETGVVIRFGVHKWGIHSLGDPCTGSGSCRPVKQVKADSPLRK